MNDYESLLETIAVLSDRDLMAELAQADRGVEAGNAFTLDEVAAEMRERGRLHE
jgi:hypothetical protein